jgi:polysaccharide deacetylase family protein (PEP-CTERM system associated)
MSVPEVLNAFTVDFEDWYQGLEIPRARWGDFEGRVEHAGRRILEILSDSNTRATFFVLGVVAEEHPGLVKEIASAGHELGTHGYAHTFVYDLTPSEYRDEMRRCIGQLEDLSGTKVLGHRAAFFSITRESLWALEILGELGIRYDSSIFPVSNYRYGIHDAPRWPHERRFAGTTILEFPVSTDRLFGRNVPIAGGAYFHIYPTPSRAVPFEASTGRDIRSPSTSTPGNSIRRSRGSPCHAASRSRTISTCIRPSTDSADSCVTSSSPR